MSDDEQALTAMDDGELLRVPVQLVLIGDCFMLDSVGLSVRPGTEPTVQASERTVDSFSKVDKGLHFYLGDFANLLEPYEWGSQVLDASCGFSLETIRKDAYVAKRVPDANRRLAQSHGHAAVVAVLPPEKQREWLEKSHASDWSVAKLKAEIAASEDGDRKTLIHVLVVDCGTAVRQAKLVKQLEAEGFKCTVRTAVKREKLDRVVTAKKRRANKINTRRKKP